MAVEWHPGAEPLATPVLQGLHKLLQVSVCIDLVLQLGGWYEPLQYLA